ncbi:30S ribosomal protein S8 [Candidatus Dependentiae bacterium]|nr:30S ribosomal protein S8 [Candidatus Dependentiae bacterium]
MSVDVVGNFLTVIRNALMVYKRSVSLPYSNLKAGIAKVLKDEGFIKDFNKTEDEKGHPILNISLKYVDGKPAINEIKRVSKPGRRFYERSGNITPVVGGLGVAILSTSSGIITDQQARKLSVGGEVICHVW